MTFKRELEALINRYGKEKPSNTPDFILAQYLENCLFAYDVAVQQRTHWYGSKEVSEICEGCGSKINPDYARCQVCKD